MRQKGTAGDLPRCLSRSRERTMPRPRRDALEAVIAGRAVLAGESSVSCRCSTVLHRKDPRYVLRSDMLRALRSASARTLGGSISYRSAAWAGLVTSSSTRLLRAPKKGSTTVAASP
jgi:hypothetical protein